MGSCDDLVTKVLGEMTKNKQASNDSFSTVLRDMETTSKLSSYFHSDSQGAVVSNLQKTVSSEHSILNDPTTNILGPAHKPRRRHKGDLDAGKGWFNMQRSSNNAELKRDLKIIQLRTYLDPKRFYKRPDKPSKFAQVATVVEGPMEFKSGRLTRKQRRATLLDEVLADDKLRNYTKRKYQEIQAEKSKVVRYKKRKPLRGRR